ncbi:MAG: penicillin-binding protein activator [Deltaproteobacteria bacterium]|nr:penicillin-binding protein activator [Deltaproteobacteria bacterium]
MQRNLDMVTRLRVDSLAFREASSPIEPALLLLDDYAEGGMATTTTEEVMVSEAEAHERVRVWIDDSTVTLVDLDALPLELFRYHRSGGFVFYKRSELLARAGRVEEAAQELGHYLTSYPKHEMASRARLLWGELGKRVGDVALKVGVLLPLSGKYRVYGESVLRGIECAAGIFAPCRGPEGIELVVRDSGGDPTIVLDAVNELAALDVVAVIGPLSSDVALVAAERAESLGVPMISLAQREGIPQVGSFIFRNSVSLRDEIESLVGYVVDKKHFKRFFVLYPQNKIGEESHKIFTSAVENRGGMVGGSRAYAPHQMEFARELGGQLITGNHYDGIFIPDAPVVAGYIAPTLALSGVGRTTLLGTSRWDNVELLTRGGEYVEGAIFVGSFSKASTDGEGRAFVDAFHAAYDADPTLLEALGYDSMRMIIASSEEGGASDRHELQTLLAQLADFPGVTGTITMDADGDVRRTLRVLTIDDGTITAAP